MPNEPSPGRRPGAVTGADLRRVRRDLDLSCLKFGRALGYLGNDNTTSLTIRRYESGARPLPPWLASRVRAYLRTGTASDGAPDAAAPSDVSPYRPDHEARPTAPERPDGA